MRPRCSTKLSRQNTKQDDAHENMMLLLDVLTIGDAQAGGRSCCENMHGQDARLGSRLCRDVRQEYPLLQFVRTDAFNQYCQIGKQTTVPPHDPTHYVNIYSSANCHTCSQSINQTQELGRPTSQADPLERTQTTPIHLVGLVAATLAAVVNLDCCNSLRLCL